MGVIASGSGPAVPRTVATLGGTPATPSGERCVTTADGQERKCSLPRGTFQPHRSAGPWLWSRGACKISPESLRKPGGVMQLDSWKLTLAQSSCDRKNLLQTCRQSKTSMAHVGTKFPPLARGAEAGAVEGRAEAAGAGGAGRRSGGGDGARPRGAWRAGCCPPGSDRGTSGSLPMRARGGEGAPWTVRTKPLRAVPPAPRGER
mmetsp:Transcript_113471/g.362057  ORF Transcript_113471/g.362057 Transcript_113471/m.362057 type:complete len:204 (+) Transcript_113471:472-1083(+)